MEIMDQTQCRTYKIFKETGVVRKIKSRTVRWLRHLFRTDEQYPRTELIFTKPCNKCERGQSPNRWVDWQKKISRNPQ